MIYRQKKVNGKHVDEHRLIMQKELGRPLGRFEYVHHKNGDKLDNRPDNLEVVTPGWHAYHHNQKYPLTKKCAVCGAEFTPDASKRRRQQTCSRPCAMELLKRNIANRKLTEAQVAEIRQRRAFGEKLTALSAAFGVSQSTISAIARNRTRQSSPNKPLSPSQSSGDECKKE